MLARKSSSRAQKITLVWILLKKNFFNRLEPRFHIMPRKSRFQFTSGYNNVRKLNGCNFKLNEHSDIFMNLCLPSGVPYYHFLPQFLIYTLDGSTLTDNPIDTLYIYVYMDDSMSKLKMVMCK